MKLPKGKKERIQMFALIAIATAGVLFAAIQYGLSPLLALRKKCIADISALEKKLTVARRKADGIGALRAQNEATKARLRGINEEYVLKEEFGNYNFSVEPIIVNAARYADVKLAGWSPRSQYGLPGRGKRELMAYPVEVTGQGGLEDLIDMIKVLETKNPYVSILDVRITPTSRRPLKHAVFFKVQWPIWRDPSIVNGFKAEETKSGKKGDESVAVGST